MTTKPKYSGLEDIMLKGEAAFDAPRDDSLFNPSIPEWQYQPPIAGVSTGNIDFLINIIRNEIQDYINSHEYNSIVAKDAEKQEEIDEKLLSSIFKINGRLDKIEDTINKLSKNISQIVQYEELPVQLNSEEIKRIREENSKAMEEILSLPEDDPIRTDMELINKLDGFLSNSYNKKISPSKYIYSRDK